MSSASRLVRIATVVVVVSVSPQLLAEPTAQERATAEALFRDAKELQAQGDLEHACAKYVESHQLDPKPGALLNAATCHEDQGKTASAWEEYRESVQLAAKYNQPERREFAEKKQRELEAKLTRVKVTMTNAPGELVIMLDGRKMSAALLGTPIPVDPGVHTLSATAPGHAPHVQTFVAPPGPENISVDLEQLSPSHAQAPEDPHHAPPPPPLLAMPGSHRKYALTPPLPSLVLFGGALAAVSVGTAFGLGAIDKKSAVDQNCTGSFCNSAGLDANDEAHREAAISTVAFAIGGAAAIAGALYWVMRPRPLAQATPSFYVTPNAAPRAAGLVLGGAL